MENKTENTLIFETNRRLQESAQKLFMAKKELEEKNKELDAINTELKRENDRLIEEQKHMLEQSETQTEVKEKKITKLMQKQKEIILKELLIKYRDLLDAYLENQEKKADVLVNELCTSFIQNDMSTREIVELHIESIKKFTEDLNEMSARRKVFAARSVLLMIMTKYASLLRE